MKKITVTLRYILSVHILVLLILTVFRAILLINNWDNIVDEPNKFLLITTAFIKGVWFDNVITCYINLLPTVVLSIFALCNKINKVAVRVFSIYYMILFGIVFIASTADIPYFAYFFKHLDSSIFNWKEEGGAAITMIFQEVSYYGYFALFLIIEALFCFLMMKIEKMMLKKDIYKNLYAKDYLIYIPITLAVWALCFLGIRGRLGMNPIRTSQAYFCDNSFLNQMGLNPTFYLMRDILENSKKHNSINNLVTEKEAIATVQHYLGINSNSSYSSPIARNIVAEGESHKYNVVIILMESMSMNFLDMEYKGKPITPYLNDLAKKSYFFNRF
jgi:phosphoglycerol transferase MdoB-like AlkP superfamily enzyme